jgi:hypothetical protein
MFDKYMKFILTVIALTLVALALRSMTSPRQVAAQYLTQEAIENMGKAVTASPIPKSWGRLVAVVPLGGSMNMGSVVSWLYFEAPDGTVRMLHSRCGDRCDMARTTYPRK